MVATVLKLALSALISILTKAATKETFEWLILYVGEKAVKSTKTPHDDAFYAKIVEANKDVQG